MLDASEKLTSTAMFDRLLPNITHGWSSAASRVLVCREPRSRIPMVDRLEEKKDRRNIQMSQYTSSKRAHVEIALVHRAAYASTLIASLRCLGLSDGQEMARRHMPMHAEVCESPRKCNKTAPGVVWDVFLHVYYRSPSTDLQICITLSQESEDKYAMSPLQRDSQEILNARNRRVQRKEEEDEFS